MFYSKRSGMHMKITKSTTAHFMVRLQYHTETKINQMKEAVKKVKKIEEMLHKRMGLEKVRGKEMAEIVKATEESMTYLLRREKNMIKIKTSEET